MRFKNFYFELPLTRRNLTLITIGSWLCLGLLIGPYQQTLKEGLTLFNRIPNYSLPSYIHEMGIYVLGHFVMFLLPGLLWLPVLLRYKYTTIEFLSISFIVSLALLIGITTIFKLVTGEELRFIHFFYMLMGLTFFGLIAMYWRSKTPLPVIAISLTSVLLCLVLFFCVIVVGWFWQDKILWVQYEKHFSPEYVLTIPLGMQDDIFEKFGLTNSLKKQLLPYWDLEYADRFGYSIIDPPLSVFISLFLLLFCGESFAVQSLSTLLVLIASFWLVVQLATLEREGSNPFFFVLVIFLLFLNYIFVFLRHHEASTVFIVPLHLMSLFVVTQFYFLLTEKYNFFLAFALLAFLTKFEAFLFTLAGLWFYQSIFKPTPQTTLRLLKKFFLLISPYILVMLMIGMLRGDSGIYLEAFFIERFIRLDHFHFFDKIFAPEATLPWDGFSFNTTWEFLKQFMLGSAFLGLAILYPQKDKISKFFQGMCILYFILVVISRVKRVHYISPLVFMSLVVFFRAFFSVQRQKQLVLFIHCLTDRIKSLIQK